MARQNEIMPRFLLDENRSDPIRSGCMRRDSMRCDPVCSVRLALFFFVWGFFPTDRRSDVAIQRKPDRKRSSVWKPRRPWEDTHKTKAFFASSTTGARVNRNEKLGDRRSGTGTRTWHLFHAVLYRSLDACASRSPRASRVFCLSV